MTRENVNRASTARAGLGRLRFPHHLAPSALPVTPDDLRSGLNAGRHPADALARYRAALMARTEMPVCTLMESGRAGMALILMALKRTRKRSRVIVPAYTCPTVVQSVLRAGLQPVFCDVSVDTLGLDLEALRRLVNEDVLAILLTHLYGLAQDSREVLALGREHGAYVVEDAAQAFGATFRGRMVGTWGDAGIYSMGRGKCIPAGHGGVVVTRADHAAALEEACADAGSADAGSADAGSADAGSADAGGTGWRALPLLLAYGLATHPVGWWLVARSPFNPAEEGMIYDTLPPIALRRMPPVYAGLGMSILKRLDEAQAVARQHAARLRAALIAFDFVSLPQVPAEATPVYLRLPIVIRSAQFAEELYERLWHAGLGVSRSYRRTLPDMCSGVVPSNPEDFPQASHLASSLLTLPTHAYLQAEDIESVVCVFREVDGRG